MEYSLQSILLLNPNLCVNYYREKFSFYIYLSIHNLTSPNYSRLNPWSEGDLQRVIQSFDSSLNYHTMLLNFLYIR